MPLNRQVYAKYGITSHRSAPERPEPRIECSSRRFYPSAPPETTLHRPACTNGSPGSAVNLGSGTIYWKYYAYGYTPIQDISYAGGSGALLTQILRDPFNRPQAQFKPLVWPT